MSYAPSMFSMPGVVQNMYQQPMQYQTMNNSMYAAQGVRWVDGVDEVRRMFVPSGLPYMFMDRNKPCFYFVEVDRNGIMNVRECSFQEASQEAQATNECYITKDQFENALKELEEKYESAISAARAEHVDAECKHAAASTQYVDEPVYAKHIPTPDAITVKPVERATGANASVNWPNAAVCQNGKPSADPATF